MYEGEKRNIIIYFNTYFRKEFINYCEVHGNENICTIYK